MKISRDSVNGKAYFFAPIMRCQSICPADGYRKVIGSGYVDNARQLSDGCLQRIVAGVDLVIDRQHQYMVPVEAEVFVPDIIHLPEDDEGRDDEEQRDGELNDDQRAA